MAFQFVKKKGQSDDYQKLSHISNKVDAALSVTVLDVSYNGKKLTHEYYTRSVKKSAAANRYADVSEAVRGFLKYGTVRNEVREITYKGLNGVEVGTIFPSSPSHMGAVY